MTTDHALVVGELHQIEERIREDESKSIMARWEFGRVLLDQRGDNGRLKHGLLAAVIQKDGISRSEIHRRMQLAEKFKTDREVSHAWDRHGSWRRLASEELPNAPRKEKPEPTFDESVEKALAWWLKVGSTNERRQKLATQLRKALEELEAAAEAQS